MAAPRSVVRRGWRPDGGRAASPKPLDLSHPQNPLYRPHLREPIESLVVEVPPSELADAPVLTDDRPVLDVLYLEATQFVRKGYTRNFTKEFLAAKLPLFY